MVCRNQMSYQGEGKVQRKVPEEHLSPARWKHQGMACAVQGNWVPIRATGMRENSQPGAHHQVILGNP